MNAPIAGGLLIIGSLVAWSGLVTPFAGKVYGLYGRPDQQGGRVAFIEANMGWWKQHNFAFAGGALVTAVGPLWVGGSPLAWAAAAAWIVGGVAGSAFAIERGTTPPDQYWARTGPSLAFWTYTSATFAGSIMLALHVGGWAGPTAVAVNGLFVAYTAWKRDMPPFGHYIPAVVLGVALL